MLSVNTGNELVNMSTFTHLINKARKEQQTAVRWVKALKMEYDIRRAITTTTHSRRGYSFDRTNMFADYGASIRIRPSLHEAAPRGPLIKVMSASEYDRIKQRNELLERTLQQQKKTCTLRRKKDLHLAELKKVVQQTRQQRHQLLAINKMVMLELKEYFESGKRHKRKRKMSTPEENTGPITFPVSQQLLDLEEFYIKFDSVLEELEDQRDLLELQGFKQLVIQELVERAEAMEKVRERGNLVIGQLNQKFIMDDLGLAPSIKRKTSGDEWVQIQEDISKQPTEEPDDEWIICGC